MTTYNEDLLVQKLVKLVDTQDSISLLSHCKQRSSVDPSGVYYMHVCFSNCVDVDIGMIHHRRHASESVRTWMQQLIQGNLIIHRISTYIICKDNVNSLEHVAPVNRKLTFVYLCNDVVQNSRRKGEEYVKSFALHLPEAVKHIHA